MPEVRSLDARREGRRCNYMQLFWKHLQSWRGYLLGILDVASEIIAGRSYEPILRFEIQHFATM